MTPDESLIQEPFLVLDTGMHTTPITSMAVDANGRFIVTGSYDKALRIWSCADGRLLRTIRVPAGPRRMGRIYAVAITPDGNTIAAGGWTVTKAQRIYLFARASGKLVGFIGPLRNVVLHLAFSPDGNKLAVALGKSNGVQVYDLTSRVLIREDKQYSARCNWVTFDLSGNLATISYDSSLRLYDPLLNPTPMTPLTPTAGGHPYSVAFSPEGRIAVGYDDARRVDIVDGEAISSIHVQEVDGGERQGLNVVAWSKDGGTLYAGGRWARNGKHPLCAWANQGRGPAQEHAVLDDRIRGILTFTDGSVAVATAKPDLSMLDRTGSLVWRTNPRTADFRDQHGTLKMTPDGKRVLFGFEQYGRSPACFDLRHRTLQIDPAPDSACEAARCEGLEVTWRNTESPELRGKPLPMANYERSLSMAVAPDCGSFVLGSEWRLRRFDSLGALVWEVTAPGNAYAVNITGDCRLVLAAFGDGTIRWHRFKDGAELLAFYPHNDRNRWIAWTTVGHYAASPGGEDLIQWQINRGLDQEPDVYSASRFREHYYRPDVVERVLDELDPIEALRAADREVGRATVVKTIAEDTPPRVAIIDPADGTFVEHPALVIAYIVEDSPGTAINRLRLLLDGRIGGEQRNLTIPANGQLKGELTVALQGERPLLTLIAESWRGSSDPATITVRRRAQDHNYKPNLYALVIGVSLFKNHDYLKLQFAAKDAAAFAERLRFQEGGLYQRVDIYPLRDEEATGSAILKGLVWLERQMTSKDVAVAFFSTHGANAARGEFFLCPYDVDLEDEIQLRFTGVRYTDLRGTLVRLADRGKTLVFLDACHSGNVIKGAKAGPADIDQVAADLAASENGVIVFSSSTGKQFSVELPELTHGAFTAALLEAFDGKSNRPPPWLSVSDLDVWLRERVKKLTNNAQTPCTSVPGERFTNPRVFMMCM